MGASEVMRRHEKLPVAVSRFKSVHLRPRGVVDLIFGRTENCPIDEISMPVLVAAESSQHFRLAKPDLVAPGPFGLE
jgi:hypothetical protein